MDCLLKFVEVFGASGAGCLTSKALPIVLRGLTTKL